jgi:AcrR family transcriptional regulator
MGIPKDEKRKALLQAASEVLLEHGPHKTTLDDIAGRAGMAKTSLYYYFKDKDEIMRAIIKSDLEQLLDLINQAVAKAETAEEKILAFSLARYNFIAGRAQRANRQIVSAFRSLEGVFETERDFYLQSCKEIIERILREGIEKGELIPLDDIELVSLIMVSSMFGCDHTFEFYDQRDRVLDGIKQMVRIFFAGMKTKKNHEAA